jgi:acyl carrier protein
MSSASLPTPARILELIDGQLIELPAGFGPEEDLFEAGLDSMAIMQLLLILEEEYGTVIPMGEVTRDNFHTSTAITRLVVEKQSTADPGA